MLPRHAKVAVFAPALSNDLRSSPRLARQLGFAGLQLPIRFGSIDLTQLSATGYREVRHLLSGQEQQPASIAGDLGSKGFGPGADIDRLLSTLSKVLEAARGLGADSVCVDLGPLPQPPRDEKPAAKPVTSAMAGLILLPTATEVAAVTRPPGPPETTDAGFFAQVDAAMLELGKLADRTGVTLALRSDLSSLAALERALKAAGCPWFGVDLDPVALLRDEWPPDEAFSRLGDLIRHVRVRDAVGGAGGRTRPAVVGRGDTDWPALLARIDDAGFGGWLTVDPTEHPDRVAAAAAALAQLSDARA